MKNEVCKKLEGYVAYNECMRMSVERFFSGSQNNKELCEEYIEKHHPYTTIRAVKATLYYEIPEDQTFCNKGEKCSKGACYCSRVQVN
jgi:hypothetical protein